MISKASFVRQLAQLSLIGFAYFLGAVTALHVLHPDYDPISRTISEYANGAYGFLMTSSFVMLGLGSGALVLALARDGWVSSGRSRIGIILFTLWGVGVLVLSIFPTDRYGIPVSRNGIIHSFVALIAFVCLVVASVLLSLRFRHDVQLRSFARPSLTLAILTGVSLVVFLVSPAAFKGITERVLVLVVLVWLSWVALKLRSLYATSSIKLSDVPLPNTMSALDKEIIKPQKEKLMNDSSMSKESLHDQFVAKENPHNSPMSKETIRSGNAMMIENIMQMPVQSYQDGKAVYRVAEIRGRQSGQIRRTPLAVFQYNGKHYLIAPTRHRDWVHNLITAGECSLVTNAEQEQSKATLTLDGEAIAAVQAYMAQLPDWSLAQFPFKADASTEEMQAKREEFAVFRIS